MLKRTHTLNPSPKTLEPNDDTSDALQLVRSGTAAEVEPWMAAGFTLTGSCG